MQMYCRKQEQKTDVNVLPTSPTKSTATSTATPTAIFAATSAATYAAICAAVLFVCLFDPDAVHSNQELEISELVAIKNIYTSTTTAASTADHKCSALRSVNIKS